MTKGSGCSRMVGKQKLLKTVAYLRGRGEVQTDFVALILPVSNISQGNKRKGTVNKNKVEKISLHLDVLGEKDN